MHRRKASLANSSTNKRLRGYHIKKGLDELGDLDATATKASDETSRSKNETAVRSISEKNRPKHKKEVAKLASKQGNNKSVNRKRQRELLKEDDESLIRRAKVIETTNETTTLAKTVRHEQQEQEHEEEQMEQETPMYKSVFGKDWSEWRHVKELLFDISASISEKWAALQIIRIWHARARKDRILPAYVQSTELLMEVVLHDEQTHCTRDEDVQETDNNTTKLFAKSINTTQISGSLLRLLYGTALSRVVHIMTGSFANEVHGQTYRARARKIELPEEIVEVRQRVAHGAMPSLSELRWVCGLTLQYLYHHYWVEQEKHIREMEQYALLQERKIKKLQKQKQREEKRNNKHKDDQSKSVPDASKNTNNKTGERIKDAHKKNNGIGDVDEESNIARVSIDDIKQFLSNLESEEEEEEEQEEEEEKLEQRCEEQKEELPQNENTNAAENCVDDGKETTAIANEQGVLQQKQLSNEMSLEQSLQENSTSDIYALTNNGSTPPKPKCVING